MAIRAESFYFDGETGGTLQTRIKRRVVSGILSGQFGPGERMPSSRALARHLGISRITVTIAYTDLVADDYLEARGRSGYFVSGAALASPNLAPSSPGEESAVDWSRLLGHRTRGRARSHGRRIGGATPIRSSTARPTRGSSTIRTGACVRCRRSARRISMSWPPINTRMTIRSSSNTSCATSCPGAASARNERS
jgi:hypothetical protein